MNRAQAPGSGTGGPDPSQSHASPTELQVSAEGGRLGAQHAPAWLRWGNRRGPAHSPSPPARAPGGEPATANRPAGHSKGPRGPSLTSRMGEAGLTSTGQAAGNPARKVGGGAQVCACACTCMCARAHACICACACVCACACSPTQAFSSTSFISPCASVPQLLTPPEGPSHPPCPLSSLLFFRDNPVPDPVPDPAHHSRPCDVRLGTPSLQASASHL